MESRDMITIGAVVLVASAYGAILGQTWMSLVLMI